MFNAIIQSPFSFQPISSNFKNWNYKKVNKVDSLIILKELDLTKAAAARATDGAHAVAVTIAVTATAGDAYWKIRDQAKEEFEKTGKIKGFEVLNLRTMEKLWISHYDMKILNELQTTN